MRHPWQRLLLLRAHLRSSPHVFPHSQVTSQSNLHSFSHFHTNTLHPKLPTLHPIFNSPLNPRTPNSRNLSSNPELDSGDSDLRAIAEIFSDPRNKAEISKDLESSNVELSHGFVLSLLRSLKSSPDVAKRVFDWVCGDKSPSSKWCNQMLYILGVNGDVEEFWELFSDMKKRAFGVEAWVYDKVLKKFEKDGLESDAERLRGVYGIRSTESSVARVCKIIRKNVWSDDTEMKLSRDPGVRLSRDVIKMVVESLSAEPTKALLFFRWVEEFYQSVEDVRWLKHDQEAYNALARVLGRRDFTDRFWKVVDEMRSNGYELESKTFVDVSVRFLDSKLIKDAVDLYEFAMAGTNKPSAASCTLLLKKIVVDKELDVELFSRVVRIYTETGNALTNSMLNAVVKSLNSVGRLGECNKVFKVIEEGGPVASAGLQSLIAFRLGKAGKEDDASDFINIMQVTLAMQEFGTDPEFKAWSSLIEGYCVAGDLEKASDCFRKMIEREGVASAGSALELLVNAYCRKNRATGAYKFLSDLVSKRQVKPWQTTYKLLISKLLAQGEFGDALHILGLMKNDGFPPFIDPFIKHVSKFGTGDDAIAFLKTMASKEFPSTIVFLRVFEAYFKAGRRSAAQDFLSRCPGYIRDHADVLNLFCPRKSGEGAATNVVAA